MRAGWTLAAHVLLWVAAFPLFNLTVGTLEKYRQRLSSGWMTLAAAIILCIWAALIYRFCVPAASKTIVRVGYLAAFILLMCAAGVCSVWLAFWSYVLTFGL